MTDQHRATPEQWALIAKEAAEGWTTHSCILELRACVAALWEEMRDRTDTLAAADGDTTSLIFKVTNRVESLEAAQLAIRSGPESPLVERVADAIAGQATSAGIVNDRPARAAIREVAAWIRLELNGRSVADRLEQEAGR